MTYYQKNKHKWREYAANRRKKFPEAVRKCNRAARAKNADKARSRCAAWRAANKERVAAYNRRYREANAAIIKERHGEKLRIASRRWRDAHPEAVAEMTSRRRKRIRVTAAMDPWSKMARRSFYVIGRRISRCLGIPHEVDHVVPLAKGGQHNHENLQVIPAKLNRLKGARLTA